MIIWITGISGSGKTTIAKEIIKTYKKYLPNLINIDGDLVRQFFGQNLKYNEEDRHKLFVLKPLYQRALIVFGGPLANFLLALVIFFSIYTFVGKDFTPAMIAEVQKDSPAMVGGLKQNDIILEIDGNKVESIMDVSKFIMMSTDNLIDFKVKRSYDELILKIKPDTILGEDNLGNKINKRIVGIKLSAYNNEINHVKLGPAQAVIHAAHEVYYVTTLSLIHI